VCSLTRFSLPGLPASFVESESRPLIFVFVESIVFAISARRLICSCIAIAI
jgi:hypothetical protein